MSKYKPYILSGFFAWGWAFSLTWLAGRCIFSEAMRSLFPGWVLTAIFYIGMWPSVAMEKIGFDVTNHASGLLQNGLGWMVVVLIITYIVETRKRSRKT